MRSVASDGIGISGLEFNIASISIIKVAISSYVNFAGEMLSLNFAS